MPYCEVATILKVNPELPQEAEDTGYDRVVEIIEQVTIPKAESIIHSMLADRYRVPISEPVPRLITSLMIDLVTVYTDTELDQGRGEKAETDSRYESALSILVQIRDGKIPLVDDSSGAVFAEKTSGDRDSEGIHAVDRYGSEPAFSMEDHLL